MGILQMNKFNFYVCLGAAVCLFFANESRACENNPKTLAKIEHQLTLRIFAFYIKNDDSIESEYGQYILYKEAKDKAHSITMDNFSCREWELLKIKVIMDLNKKLSKNKKS